MLPPPPQAAPEPGLLPGHSCPGLARRECPDLPSPLFPAVPPGGPSAPGHSPRRGSDKKGEGGVGSVGSRRAGVGRMGEPHPELSRGALPGVPPPASWWRLCFILRGPDPSTGFEFPPGSSSVGPSQSHFPDRRVGGGGGAHRGTICPCCSCNPAPTARTRCEDSGWKGRLQTPASPPKGRKEWLREEPGPQQTPWGVGSALLPQQIPASRGAHDSPVWGGEVPEPLGRSTCSTFTVHRKAQG